MPDQLTGTLMENVITLLAYDDVNGKIISNLIDVQLLEGEYKHIAERCVNYWRKYGEAPKSHTPDLFASTLEDRHNPKRETYRRILTAMLHLSESINAVYVVNELARLTRLQQFKAATIRAAERLNSPNQELAVDEVEQIWADLLHTRQVSFDPGTRLIDYDRMLSFVKSQFTDFDIGIRVLDERHIVPYRNSVMLFLAPKGRGKSWFLINAGKRALRQRKRVLHITLEMQEDETKLRYYQSLFAIPKRWAKIEITRLDMDRFGKLKGLSFNPTDPEFAFDSQHITDELQTRVMHFGKLFENLIIKKFPTSSLTIPMLRAYLDNLEVVEGFIPDMIILDYVGIVHTDEKNKRVSLGTWFQNFRGICEQRNAAGVTAQQVSKAGAEAMHVANTHVGEDWSLVHSADQVITQSSTDTEFKLGLARLYVANARSEADRFRTLVTQSYPIGQYALDSLMLDENYFDLIKEYQTEADGVEADDDYDE